jgi:hypothetical protein
MQFNFDLDLPTENSGETFLKSPTSPVLQTSPQNAPALPPKAPVQNTPSTGLGKTSHLDTKNIPPSSQPTAEGLGEEKVEVEDPFKVRMDLAEELWKLGQKHTGRALAQEVAEQASLDMQDRAKRWLAEHA